MSLTEKPKSLSQGILETTEGPSKTQEISRELQRRHPEQMPEPPQECPLYSEALVDDQMSPTVPKGEPDHPAKETHLGHIYSPTLKFWL